MLQAALRDFAAGPATDREHCEARARLETLGVRTADNDFEST